MSEQTMQKREALSALLDNEADDLALRRLLKAVGEEPDAAELLGAWERYHLVQSVLHGVQVTAGPGLSQRVAAAIAAMPGYEEGRPSVPPPARLSPRRLPLKGGVMVARVAIAASVAAAVFLSLQTDLLDPTEPEPPSSLSGTPAGSQPSSLSGAPDSRAAVAVTDLRPAAGTEADVAANVRLYLERVYGTEEREPVHLEHLQDSPLYRLVNELRAEGAVPYTPAP